MKLFKGTLTVIDEKPITERIGKSKINVIFSRKPNHGDYIPFFCDNEDCESPGTIMATDNVNWDSETVCTFEDLTGRMYILENIRLEDENLS